MKKLLVGLIVMGLLFTTACGKKVEHYGVEAKTPGFESLQEMEDSCSVIVKVIREEQEEPIITSSDGRIVSGYTFSQVNIEQIYKDDTDTLEVGDTIRILENEVFSEQEQIIYHIAGYNMMEEGKEYLLFLNKSLYFDKEPYYVASGVNYGTVSLEEDDRTTVYLSRNGQQVVEFSAMQPIWDAAIEKYIRNE